MSLIVREKQINRTSPKYPLQGLPSQEMRMRHWNLLRQPLLPSRFNLVHHWQHVNTILLRCGLFCWTKTMQFDVGQPRQYHTNHGRPLSQYLRPIWIISESLVHIHGFNYIPRIMLVGNYFDARLSIYCW